MNKNGLRRIDLGDCFNMLVSSELPFFLFRWAMLVIVPNKKDGLNSLLPKLESEGLTKVLSASFTKQTTAVSLPRFKLTESTIDGKELLKKLGMSAVFSRTTADLSKMCSSQRLFISDVKHKAVLEVCFYLFCRAAS